ncbi:MAG: Na/Pi cotransporter family protein [Treponema sp.]|jgi:phosphate:Na+ symporter|nr:Na/Pi cotransporter family protein [Treponema sp.]
MDIVSLILNMVGGLCMFLFGMKTMSDGIQQSAGDRLRKTLNLMTGSRFAGVLTGFAVTAIIQSSSATTVMVVSFVNAGLLTLTQSIGVIMGANVGTTITAWIVSLLGFSLKISNMALPAIGIGFILGVKKWKYRSLGNFVMGFGFLFMGLHFLTQEMSSINKLINVEALAKFTEMGFLSVIIGTGVGFVMTMLLHSSSATTAIVLTMAYNGILSYTMAAGMVLGANIGTTIDALLASIGAKTEARRAAIVHLLFNVIGVCWALPLLIPLLRFIDFITPGPGMLEIAKIWKLGMPLGFGVTVHLAMLQTIFNLINTILFFPFVKQFAAFISFIIPEKPGEQKEHYKFEYLSSVKTSTPELNILRAEKEIRDMAGIASSMYAQFSSLMQNLLEIENKESAAEKLCEDLKPKEEYIDEMRETLTTFLIECTRKQLASRTEHRVSQLLRVVNYIEEMSDDCYIISLLLEKSIKKNRILKKEEMDKLVPYVNMVGEFLDHLQEQLGQPSSLKLSGRTNELEKAINKSRKDLQKLGRKRIEAGKDVKTELFFIDLVRRIEKLGDYCYDISNALRKIELPLFKRLFTKN